MVHMGRKERRTGKSTERGVLLPPGYSGGQIICDENGNDQIVFSEEVKISNDRFFD